MAWLTDLHADRHWFLLADVGYGLSLLYSTFLWRRGFRQDNRLNYLLLAVGFAFNTVAMFMRGFNLRHCPVNNLYEATIFVAWTIAAVCLVMGAWSRLRVLCAFVSPALFAIGLFALMPALDPPHGPKPQFSGAAASAHAALVLLAYGAFGLAAASGIMFVTQEHNLKFHKLRAVLSFFPPLQRLESVTSRLVVAGFILLTVGLAIGGELPRPAGVEFYQDAKVVWSAVLWLLYLVLLVLRWKFAQSGRRFAIGVIGVFVFVALTFWGTNLLSPLHQHAP